MVEVKSTTTPTEVDPDMNISLENGRRLGKQAEQADPKFKTLMDKLRKAAKTVMKMVAFLVIGLLFSKRTG